MNLMARVMQKMPSPLAIAFLLGAVSAFFGWVLGPADFGLPELADSWYQGMWSSGLLSFAFQMMAMLVLGHAIALSPLVEKTLSRLLAATGNNQVYLLVALIAMLASLLNWGLGLIIGAVLARKVGERAAQQGALINYPLIGAAAYTGLMVWHGGLSGSAPLIVSMEGHFLQESLGVVTADKTTWSAMNLVATVAIVTAILLTVRLLQKRAKLEVPAFEQVSTAPMDAPKGFAGLLAGGALLIVALTIIFQRGLLTSLDPNLINTLLLALGLMLHRSLGGFTKAVGRAISGSAGILVQFPLYFGIMGVMKASGSAQMIGDFFVSISNIDTFPILTFISAGILNIFVPSGGGQWAIQGPIIAQAVQDLSVPTGKAIMAMCYGDQLTNMLQPFWALPLLGITGLKAKEIFPYTVVFFFVGAVVYGGVLVLF